jgi:hypothetical protein
MINRLVDRPERVFQVWAFTVGMNRLLLRSTKSETHPTRVDVLFQNVKAMNLPTQLDGLVVTEAGAAREIEIIEETGLLPGEGTVFFEVESSGRIGFVVAGVVVEDEDEGEFFEPSKYWPGPEGFAR